MSTATLGILSLKQPDWYADALCPQTDPEIFYPEVGENPRHAKNVCSRCPVQSKCLEMALNQDELYGIWGGLSREERENIRRLRNQATSAKRRKAERNATIVTMARDNVENKVIAEEIGISERTVNRVLRAHRQLRQDQQHQVA